MRVLTPAAAAALASSLVPLAVLVEMDLDSGPLRLNTAGMDLVIDGQTYLGTRGLGRIDAVQDTPAEIRALSFELSGVQPTSVAQVLGEPVQGRSVRIKLAILDPATYQVVQVHQRWSGRLDTMTLEDAAGGLSTVKVTAEHAAIDLLRTSPSLYSDAEQRRLAAGDPSLQYMADQVDVRVIWPAASWGRG